MPFCASCGSQVEGKFCPKCGAAVDATASVPPGSAAGPSAAPVSAPMTDNVASMLCYVLGLITGIIFLVLEPYSKNPRVRFHAFQSIFMHLAIIVLYIVMGILLSAMTAMLGFMGLLTAVLYPVLGLGSLVLWVYLLISTYQGKTIVLPVIGPLAKKQAGA